MLSKLKIESIDLLDRIYVEDLEIMFIHLNIFLLRKFYIKFFNYYRKGFITQTINIKG